MGLLTTYTQHKNPIKTLHVFAQPSFTAPYELSRDFTPAKYAEPYVELGKPGSFGL